MNAHCKLSKGAHNHGIDFFIIMGSDNELRNKQK